MCPFQEGANDLAEGKPMKKSCEFKDECQYKTYKNGYIIRKAINDSKSGITSNLTGFSEEDCYEYHRSFQIGLSQATY